MKMEGGNTNNGREKCWNRRMCSEALWLLQMSSAEALSSPIRHAQLGFRIAGNVCQIWPNNLDDNRGNHLWQSRSTPTVPNFGHNPRNVHSSNANFGHRLGGNSSPELAADKAHMARLEALPYVEEGADSIGHRWKLEGEMMMPKWRMAKLTESCGGGNEGG
jgi:hypothetical protein